MLPKGVIEGFYGKVWSWAERERMVQFLSENSFNSYWYAPKADKKLRNNWIENWTSKEFQQLSRLSDHCLSQGVQFGIGLSPLALYDEWDTTGRKKLLDRLKQIAQLNPGGLVLLFDDMQGDLPGLARVQSEIAHVVAENIEVDQLMVCPSYYSFDPVLEELFGTMPDNYWSAMGDLLDQSIDLLWTGDHVVSREYPKTGLLTISEAFKRKPVIWDNSIVNDGRKTSPFLNIRAMHSLQHIEEHVKGVLVNPMNAAALSEIPLASLNLQGSEYQRLLVAIEQCSPEYKEAIVDNLSLFNDIGRDGLSDTNIKQINKLFRHQNHPIALNIISWLDGEFVFDPDCLT